jgi:hypothetical protein
MLGPERDRFVLAPKKGRFMLAAEKGPFVAWTGHREDGLWEAPTSLLTIYLPMSKLLLCCYWIINLKYININKSVRLEVIIL